MRQQRALSQQKFTATLLAMGPGGAWTHLQIPFDVVSVYGTRSRVSVSGTINDFPFQSSIFPDGEGGFHLMVNKAMQVGAGAKSGDEVEVVMYLDTAERTVEIPADMEKALKKNQPAKANFAKMAPGARKEYVEWITGAKQQQTRERRIEKALTLISEGKRLKS
jgi:hypothetical protein